MSQLQEIRQKIFFECQSVLENISKINSVEELLNRQDLFYEVSERIAFLRLLEKNESLLPNVVYEAAENQDVSYDASSVANFENAAEELHIEEEVAFNNELNEIGTENDEETAIESNTNSAAPDFEFESENTDETHEVEAESTEQSVTWSFADEVSNVENDEVATEESSVLPALSEEVLEEELIAESTISEDTYERNVDALERADSLVQEHNLPSNDHDLRKINEIERHEAAPDLISENTPAQNAEKKFKIASIKGLNKNIQSLFDNDPLEEVPAPIVSGSLQKANMPTGYMEAERGKPDFKLDLNDRIAFIQNLFGGSQTELNEAVQKLNSFNNLDQAKEYLSDLYYERNWKKVDDYAQRLWSLVENKFL